MTRVCDYLAGYTIDGAHFALGGSSNNPHRCDCLEATLGHKLDAHLKGSFNGTPRRNRPQNSIVQAEHFKTYVRNQSPNKRSFRYTSAGPYLTSVGAAVTSGDGADFARRHPAVATAQHAQETRAAFVDDFGADFRGIMFAGEPQPQLSELYQTISFNFCKTQ